MVGIFFGGVGGNDYFCATKIIMMRFKTLLIALGLAALACQAREIRPVEAVAADYVPLLRHAGYEAYPFDISSLSDSMHQIRFVIREYEHGNLVSKDYPDWPKCRNNMMLVSQFSPEDQASIKLEEMADPDRGIYSLAKKMQIGFVPAERDSLRPVLLDVENIGTMSIPLKMKPVEGGIGSQPTYMYASRPFAAGQLAIGEFTPLVLLGSYWFDERFNVTRFCGESVIDADMQAEILKNIPHYYVIGVVITPVGK